MRAERVGWRKLKGSREVAGRRKNPNNILMPVRRLRAVDLRMCSQSESEVVAS